MKVTKEVFKGTLEVLASMWTGEIYFSPKHASLVYCMWDILDSNDTVPDSHCIYERSV